MSELLSLLTITKQSLGRVINELADRNLVETRPGERDRRQRLLRLTEEGARLESELFESVRVKMSAAYARAGQSAVAGYWAVLEGMVPDDKLAEVQGLRG